MKPLMFSTTPKMGNVAFRQKVISLRTSATDTAYKYYRHKRKLLSREKSDKHGHATTPEVLLPGLLLRGCIVLMLLRS